MSSIFVDIDKYTKDWDIELNISTWNTSNVTNMDSVFEDCTSLTSIIISKGVNNIGYKVFSYCPNLTIYCEVKSKPSGWDSNWNASNCPVVWNYGKHILDEWITDIEPTCTEAGHRYAICTICNEIVEEEIIH